jgi:D-sedoheptulose 7-phosphate isomerase
MIIDKSYVDRLFQVVRNFPYCEIENLADAIYKIWMKGGQLFICGNGGSAANADHLANDFISGVADKESGRGIRVESLVANSSVITCLANDLEYKKIFSTQLRVKAKPSDLLLVLSGSGNSDNVVEAVSVAQEIGMQTAGIIGYPDSRCIDSLQIPIHLKTRDMQIAEDSQLIIGHMILRTICNL